ncbi:hypothetical protein VKT23_000881 [Stygiomarasmius scandens]|uniref:Uncharacterized protein n=1 Tax=Marasmiellus scandens TaxID=2682957 RepID=A0ABR1KAS9_9AGAR
MSDSEDDAPSKPFGGHGGSTKPHKPRSFSPASDDGDPVATRTVDDSDSPPPQERPLIRQGLAFSAGQFTSSNEINTYQPKVSSSSGQKRKTFLPGQAVQAVPKQKKNKTKKEKTKANSDYVASTGRFRLKDYNPTAAQPIPNEPTVPAPVPTLSTFQTSLSDPTAASSPASTLQTSPSDNGNRQQSTPSDISEGTGATDVANPKLALSGILVRPTDRSSAPAAGPSKHKDTFNYHSSSSHMASTVPRIRTPMIAPVASVAPSTLGSNPYMNIVGPSKSYYRRDYDKQESLTITEPISSVMSPSRQQTQSAPLPHHPSGNNNSSQKDGSDAAMYSQSPASPPSTYSTRLSSPHIAESTSPMSAQFPAMQASHTPSHTSPDQPEMNTHFQHQPFSSPPLQARPQFRSPSSDHRPQFRPSQFDEQSSQSSQSHSPPVDVQSTRSTPMEIDPRFAHEERLRPQTAASPAHMHYQSPPQHSDHQSQTFPVEVLGSEVKVGTRSAKRPSFRSSRMVTLLITDFRNRAEDHQLAEIVVPLRPADPESSEAGFWANAEDVVEKLQSSPSRIEAPGRAYTMRGKWKQFFLRVVDGKNEVSASANLLITPERTLDVGVVDIAPSELASVRGGNERMMSMSDRDVSSRHSNANIRQDEGQYAETSRKRQRSPSEGGRERRPFSMTS